MAVSAFKSASKRGGRVSSSSSVVSSGKDRLAEDSGKKNPSRRSRSVSAMPRSSASPPTASAGLLEYSNTRDNPLFGCSSSSSPEPDDRGRAIKVGSDASGSSRRGRPVSRSSGAGDQSLGGRKESGRSLSRVDAGRRYQSVSRGRRRDSESEGEHGYHSASSLRKKDNGNFGPNDRKKTDVVANDFKLSERPRNLQTWTSRHPVSESWDTSSSWNWEDGMSSSSFSEVEETKTRVGDQPSGDTGARGVYGTVRSEVRRAVTDMRDDLENAICRTNPGIITTENIVDFPHVLVNPDATELVSDIRREYATKLEQSRERARKLWADLAVEEQREQELSRILREILSNPKSSETHKSRPRRKASIERLKMSRRLTEEAMNYFDECVSISTFDSSDFSSLEDPQLSSAIDNPPMGSSRFFPNEGSTFEASQFRSSQLYHHEESDNQTQCSLSIAESDLVVGGNHSGIKPTKLTHENGKHDDVADFDTPQSRSSHFSFVHPPTKTVGAHDIRHYMEKIDKYSRKEGLEHVKVKPSYNADDYDLNSSAESLLFDTVILRNRIESGGLLVCNNRIF